YEALYANADHQGLFSEVSVFDTEAHARAIATVWNGMVPAKTHTTAVATPAGAPGTGFALFKGTTQEDGTSVPLYLGTWVQGNAVVAVMAFGPGVTTDTLMKIAKKQDAKTQSVSSRSAA